MTDICWTFSYFGTSTFKIKGKTFQKLLNLSIKGKRCSNLKSNNMIQLQLVFLGIKYLVTDPSFGMGQKCFTLIDGKCKQATASIIFVWDFSQFPPVSDKILYHPYPTSDIAPQGFCHAKVLKLMFN